jgi:NAD(P)-dependent dehydrogenase (short-subunit alcohol dehydrogenase family)
MKLQDKVAVVTGGASGIGRETALLFAAEGAAVVVADLQRERGEETVAQIAAAGGRAIFAATDVSRAADCEAMVRRAEDAFGALHVLFNNAGVMLDGDDDAVTTSEVIWEKTLAINLRSVFLGCKYGIPALRRAGGGSIINTASFVALMGAATPQIAYTASKGGVVAMTRELAVIHARENIRAYALSPCALLTDLVKYFL